MLNWFYNWIDPKILRLEKWVNKKVVTPELIDIDLDKVKKGEERDNNMFRQPPKDGSFGPFLANLQGAEVVEFMYGVGEMEAFVKFNHETGIWWRHRDGGTTEDYKEQAFDNLKAFFEYCHGDSEKYWECQLRTKALLDEQS